MSEGWSPEERAALEAAQSAIHDVVLTLGDLAWVQFEREWDENPFPKMHIFRLRRRQTVR